MRAEAGDLDSAAEAYARALVYDEHNDVSRAFLAHALGWSTVATSA
ncbi:MAG: hypothetical protein H6732_14230 [Alphaproteobacteria bacterium]|nr:hypothetical protein [Alphaproteobacteria bacterium]